MSAVIYALAFGVILGLLSADASTMWLKVLGYILTSWMFLAAIIQAVRLTKQDD